MSSKSSSAGSPTESSITPSSTGTSYVQAQTVPKTPWTSTTPSPKKDRVNGNERKTAKESAVKRFLQPKKVLFALCTVLVLHIFLVVVMIVVGMNYQDYLELAGESDRMDHTDDLELETIKTHSFSHRVPDYLPKEKEMERSKFDAHFTEDWIMDPGNSYRFRIFNCLIILVIPALITAIALVEESFIAQLWALLFQVVSFIFSIVIITKDLYQVSTGLIVTRVLFYLNWVLVIVLSVLVLKNIWPRKEKNVDIRVVKDDEFPDGNSVSPPKEVSKRK